MAFIRILGLLGKVYVPDRDGPKKHNCKDCFFCQMCSDNRCESCLSQKSKRPQHCNRKILKKSKKNKK